MGEQQPKQQSESSTSFEEALARLEDIVATLEDGQTGLEDAMKQYEVGVRLLRECHQILKRAEQKVALLTGVDEDGQPLTQPLEEAPMSLEEKADMRSRRRSAKGTRKSKPRQVDADGDDDVDASGRLF